MVFAPKLDAGISYERPQQVAPPADYGKALTSGVSDVLKVIDDATPDKPTWSQVKDEKEAAGLRAFSRDLGIVDQLRDQGFAREAAAKGRALVGMAADWGVNMADPQIAAQLKARDITLDTLGETPEDTHNRKRRETPAWKQAETLIFGDAKYSGYTLQQKQNEVERIASQTLLDEATINQSSQSDIANWHRHGAPAVGRMMKLNVEAQVLEAQTAARLGIQIDPTSLEAKHTELTFSLAQLQSIFPAGLPQAEKDKAMAPLQGSIKVIEKLQSRGERISAGAVANLTAALAGNTDEKSIAVVALLAGGVEKLTPDVIKLILDKGDGSADAVLKTLSNADAPTFYFGAGQSQWGYGKRVRLPGGVLRKTLEEPTGNREAAMANSAEGMASLLSPETLRQNKNADPRVLLQNFNRNALTLGEMIATPDSEEAAAFNFGLAANAAAAVFHSSETFSAADVTAGYSPSFFKNLEGASTLYPGQAGSLVQANLIAVRQMGAKAAARLESVTKGWLQYSGTTLLLDYGKITTQEYSAGGNPEVQTQMKTEVKAAVEGAGGFSEFLKKYDNVSKGQAGRNPYSPLVKAFMMSKEVGDIRKDMSPISEQTKAVVALSQTAGRLQRLQDKIDKDFDERNFNNEVPDGEHVPLQPDEVRVNPAFIDQSAPAAAPVPRERPVVETTAPSAGGILGLGGFPETDGVPLGERAVGKVGAALGDAASYVGDALISPAGASTLPPAKQIENMGQDSYDTKLREYIGKGEANPVLAKNAGYASEYDVPLGYGKFDDPGGHKPLTSMTLAEVKDYQKVLVTNSRGKIKDLKKNEGSSAVGAWQIIGPTLLGLQKKLGLPDTTLFDKQTQDLMLKELLREAGSDKFKAGEITAEQFQDNLALKWASVPNRNGKSAYGQPLAHNTPSPDLPPTPIPAPRPGSVPDDELPESQILDTVTQTVPDATPKEVKEVIDHLQGANTLDAIRALGARQRAIMSAILNAYSEEGQQQPEQPAASSTVGSGPYRQPTPTPFVLGE